MKTFDVTTHQTITAARVSETLCCAFEGGSNYWYEIKDFIAPKNFDNTPADDICFKHLSYPINEGGALLIGVKGGDKAEGHAGALFRLDLDAITKGLAVLAEKFPDRLAEIVDENEDAETGDILLQICLFGEVVYG
jgi:hypothetical protein